MMPHMPPRRRLGSVGDSAPPSESSEGTASETCEINHDWSSSANPTNGLFINSDADDNMSIGTNTSNLLTDNERAQVESFFGGLGTEIYVCSALANLYESSEKDNWRLLYTGIPVLLHDKGVARSRSLPRVSFVLAERGSSFAMWSDKIDNLSDYRVAGPSFHTMCYSHNHQQLMGLSFDSKESALELWSQVERLVSDPENIALSAPGRKKSKQKQKRQKPAPLPPKSQISHPCQFSHVTSVTKEDSERYYSMQAFTAGQLKHR